MFVFLITVKASVLLCVRSMRMPLTAWLGINDLHEKGNNIKLEEMELGMGEKRNCRQLRSEKWDNAHFPLLRRKG